ncbi:MAG: hypothetical protein V7752_04170 [Halopseudomonas sp.]
MAELHIPRLAERLEDTPLLFDYFGRKAALQYERDFSGPTEDDIAALMNGDWPGNFASSKMCLSAMSWASSRHVVFALFWAKRKISRSILHRPTVCPSVYSSLNDN